MPQYRITVTKPYCAPFSTKWQVLGAGNEVPEAVQVWERFTGMTWRVRDITHPGGVTLAILRNPLRSEPDVVLEIERIS